MDDALFRPEVRAAVPSDTSNKAGPIRCGHFVPANDIYTYWDYFRNAYGRDAGLRIDHLLINPFRGVASSQAPASIERFAVGRNPAIMRRRWIELAD